MYENKVEQFYPIK